MSAFLVTDPLVKFVFDLCMSFFQAFNNSFVVSLLCVESSTVSSVLFLEVSNIPGIPLLEVSLQLCQMCLILCIQVRNKLLVLLLKSLEVGRVLGVVVAYTGR